MDNCSSIFPRFVVGPRQYLEQALCGEGHPTVLAEGLRGQGRLVLGGAEGALQLLPGSGVGQDVELHGGICVLQESNPLLNPGFSSGGKLLCGLEEQ